MKDHSLYVMNSGSGENVNLPAPEVERARLLEDDPEAILRLVDLIFFYVDEGPAILS